MEDSAMDAGRVEDSRVDGSRSIVATDPDVEPGREADANGGIGACGAANADTCGVAGNCGVADGACAPWTGNAVARLVVAEAEVRTPLPRAAPLSSSSR